MTIENFESLRCGNFTASKFESLISLKGWKFESSKVWKLEPWTSYPEFLDIWKSDVCQTSDIEIFDQTFQRHFLEFERSTSWLSKTDFQNAVFCILAIYNLIFKYVPWILPFYKLMFRRNSEFWLSKTWFWYTIPRLWQSRSWFSNTST